MRPANILHESLQVWSILTKAMPPAPAGYMAHDERHSQQDITNDGGNEALKMRCTNLKELKNLIIIHSSPFTSAIFNDGEGRTGTHIIFKTKAHHWEMPNMVRTKSYTKEVWLDTNMRRSYWTYSNRILRHIPKTRMKSVLRETTQKTCSCNININAKTHFNSWA